jgi:hypothetical protein
MKKQPFRSTLNNQRGVSAVIIAICIFALTAFVALALDVSHLIVARNELQNAADAGALSGAGNLYLNDGTAINTNANQFGYDAAIANLSDQTPVEVNWTSGNTGDVQRGHWSFGLGNLARGFYPNASDATVDLWGVTTEELDADPDFINAVRVITRRESTPVMSFFARIFGFSGFEQYAEAVAYIGFAGTLEPAEVDAPIAICEQALLDVGGIYDCSEGRFINDAAGGEDEETGMWTSFDQGLDPDGVPVPGEDPCAGGTNASEVGPLVNCPMSGANPTTVYLGANMEVNNGQINSVFNDFYDCWENMGYPTGFMPLKLPVIDCISDPTTCAPLVGYVAVMVAWITQQPNLKDLPVSKDELRDGDNNLIHDSWQATDAEDSSGNLCSDPGNPDPDQCVWDSFADHYQLKNADGTTAGYQAKTIYFLNSCDAHIPGGITGGKNFGILAEIPVLVE